MSISSGGSVPTPEPDPDPDPVSDYYFSQGYSGVMLVNANTAGTNKTFTSWDIFGATPYLSSKPYLWEYLPPYTNMAMDDTLDSGRRSLFFEVTDNVPNRDGQIRTQYSLSITQEANLPVYRTSHRMYLSPDMADLENYEGKINWVDLFETWTKRHPDWTGNVTGSSRISLYINKDSAAGSAIYWELKANWQQPQEIQYQAMWPTKINRDHPPLFGQWFTLDVTVVPGVGAEGRVRILMTPDVGATTTLFDFNDTTVYHRDGVTYPELWRSSWQPYKFYIGDAILDWLRGRGKRAYAYYNDFKWHKNQ